MVCAVVKTRFLQVGGTAAAAMTLDKPTAACHTLQSAQSEPHWVPITRAESPPAYLEYIDLDVDSWQWDRVSTLPVKYRRLFSKSPGPEVEEGLRTPTKQKVPPAAPSPRFSQRLKEKREKRNKPY